MRQRHADPRSMNRLAIALRANGRIVCLRVGRQRGTSLTVPVSRWRHSTTRSAPSTADLPRCRQDRRRRPPERPNRPLDDGKRIARRTGHLATLPETSIRRSVNLALRAMSLAFSTKSRTAPSDPWMRLAGCQRPPRNVARGSAEWGDGEKRVSTRV